MRCVMLDILPSKMLKNTRMSVATVASIAELSSVTVDWNRIGSFAKIMSESNAMSTASCPTLI